MKQTFTLFLRDQKMKHHLLHTIFFSFILLYTTPKTISGFFFTNETDQNALFSIKNSISTDHFGVLNSWNNSIPLCKWAGITCDGKHNRVVFLNLSSSGLVGSLSPHIANLTFLKKIDLRNNTFQGNIPSGIANLIRLQFLGLSRNSFHGEIPANLSNCFSLTYFAVHSNNLTGPIPPQLSYLPNLQQILLDRNHLTGTIPPSFGNFSGNFNFLSATENNLVGDIPSELSKLSSLETIEFAYNNLSGAFPSFLFNLSSIKLVYLTGNMFPGTLPSDLGLNCPNLQRIDVSGNQLYGHIPSTIRNASQLRIIDMSNNSLVGPTPSNLGNLLELQALLIWGNKLGRSDKKGDKFRSLLTSLSNCSNLKLLDLADNEFNGFLPNSISNLSESLNYFSVDNNLLHGKIPDFGYNRLANINLLSLAGNMFTGSIPNSIGQLVTLERIYMNKNLISGEIPSSFSNLTRLGILNLGDNALEGRIPAFLGNCTSLQGIDLGNNSFRGPIPKEFFGLSSMFQLTLSHNYLTGMLPEEISKMANLDYLFLNNNELSGGIPASLASCQTLQILRLERNRFQGFIPEAIGQLKGLQFLDVSYNNLSGKIPDFLEDFSMLQYLNLSYNIFNGEVPKKGIFVNISAFSITGNKNLCGGIADLRLPACHVKTEGKRHVNRKIIAIVIVASVSLAFLLFLLAILYWTKIYKGKASSAGQSPLENRHLQLSYGEILQATDGFSQNNLIGEGRFGSVYKGILFSSEQIVAVKVLKLEERGANKSFFAECEALKNIRHRNLVKIITSCSSVDFRGNDFKALVFEYMENNCLDRWLHQEILEKPKNLDLAQRLEIAIDVAYALDYLHNRCDMGIVHCDLKPSNVLLDKDFCAHVADFGLTKILTEAIDTHKHQDSSTIAIRGTIGYVAPEYGMGEKAATQGDMYSYGILLLELLTGKRPTDTMFVDNISLRSYVNTYLSDQVFNIIDPKIQLKEDISNIPQVGQCIISMLKIGVLCSSDSPSERMDASDVVTELHKIKHSLDGAKVQMN